MICFADPQSSNPNGFVLPEACLKVMRTLLRYLQRGLRFKEHDATSLFDNLRQVL
jgi:hypothetical protein